jgi:hypothetical protein
MMRQLKMKANVFDPGSSKRRRALAFLILDALNYVPRDEFLILDVPRSKIDHESAEPCAFVKLTRAF